MRSHKIHELIVPSLFDNINEMNNAMVKEAQEDKFSPQNKKINVGILDVKVYEEFRFESVKKWAMSFLKKFDEIVLIDSHDRFEVKYYQSIRTQLEINGLVVRDQVLCGHSIVDLLGYLSTRGAAVNTVCSHRYFYLTSQTLYPGTNIPLHLDFSNFISLQSPGNQSVVSFVGLPVVNQNLPLIQSLWVIKNEMDRLGQGHPRREMLQLFLQTYYPGSSPQPIELLTDLKTMKRLFKSSSGIGNQLEKFGLFPHVKGRRVFSKLIHEIEERHFSV